MRRCVLGLSRYQCHLTRRRNAIARLDPNVDVSWTREGERRGGGKGEKGKGEMKEGRRDRYLVVERVKERKIRDWIVWRGPPTKEKGKKKEREKPRR